MDNTDSADLIIEPDLHIPFCPADLDWELAFRIFVISCAKNGGSVSSTALRREFEQDHGIADARPLLVELTFFQS